jgi:hypothetical protein
MTFNQCETCKAGNGRAGTLIRTCSVGLFECLNCYETRKSGNVVIHSFLSRTLE